MGGLVLITLVPGQAAAAVDNVPSLTLRQGVTVGGILAHERVLQRIANRNDGTRASGTPGYGESATYVIHTMRRAGYNVRKQRFIFPFFREPAPATLSQTAPTAHRLRDGDLRVLRQRRGVGHRGADRPRAPAADRAGLHLRLRARRLPAASATEDQVALIQRGTCDFAVKASNAAAAGYDAVIIFNEGQEGRTDAIEGTLGAPADLPVVDLAFADGAALAAAADAGPVTVDVSTSTRVQSGARPGTSSPRPRPVTRGGR